MSEELKPCPFCGGKASLNYERIPGEDKGFWAQVICNACHGRSGGMLSDMIEVVKAGGVE